MSSCLPFSPLSSWKWNPTRTELHPSSKESTAGSLSFQGGSNLDDGNLTNLDAQLLTADTSCPKEARHSTWKAHKSSEFYNKSLATAKQKCTVLTVGDKLMTTIKNPSFLISLHCPYRLTFGVSFANSDWLCIDSTPKISCTMPSEATLARSNLCCIYLAHHELESSIHSNIYVHRCHCYH